MCTQASILLTVSVVGADAHKGEEVFEANCKACHTIGGGKLVGPDLKGVTERRQTDWIKQFIIKPDEVLASGDPVAKQLLDEAGGAPMPNLGITDGQADDKIASLTTPPPPECGN